MTAGLFVLFILAMVFPLPGAAVGGGRSRRDVSCSAIDGYLHRDICCLKCPAGTRVKSHCSRPGDRGECEECAPGTHTEHDNGLPRCLKCTGCRPDQEVVRACTRIENTQCQCGPGRFCTPDQACEVCRKCSRCKAGQAIARNCTATTDTECKTVPTIPGSDSVVGPAVGITIPVVCVLGLVVFLLLLWWRKNRNKQRDPDSGSSAAQDNADNSSTEERRRSAEATVWPQEAFPLLDPVNGEESLRKCFDYFVDVDVDYVNRFFRLLGLRDNQIKSLDLPPYEDKVHSLLNVWVEKEGRDAALDHLLKALLDLDQRRTAEIIAEKALDRGHYVRRSSGAGFNPL